MKSTAKAGGAVALGAKALGQPAIQTAKERAALIHKKIGAYCDLAHAEEVEGATGNIFVFGMRHHVLDPQIMEQARKSGALEKIVNNQMRLHFSLYHAGEAGVGSIVSESIHGKPGSELQASTKKDDKETEELRKATEGGNREAVKDFYRRGDIVAHEAHEWAFPETFTHSFGDGILIKESRKRLRGLEADITKWLRDLPPDATIPQEKVLEIIDRINKIYHMNYIRSIDDMELLYKMSKGLVKSGDETPDIGGVIGIGHVPGMKIHSVSKKLAKKEGKNVYFYTPKNIKTDASWETGFPKKHPFEIPVFKDGKPVVDKKGNKIMRYHWIPIVPPTAEDIKKLREELKELGYPP